MNAILLGLVVGVFGAISPGPLSMALVHGSQAPRRGLLTRLVVCVAAGLAVGPLLRGVAATPSVRIALAFAYVAFGVVLTARNLRPGAPRGLGGLALAIKWVLVVGFAAWTGLVGSDLASGVGFALGVWAGVAVWFCGLATLGTRIHARHADGWFRACTLVVAGVLIAAGVYAAREFSQTSHRPDANIGIKRA